MILIYFSFFLWAQSDIDPRYDNYDSEVLVLKLIEDNQWPLAQSVFQSESKKIQVRSASDYHLIQGLLFKHDRKFDLSADQLLQSINIRYSDIALNSLLNSFQQLKRFDEGLAVLNQFHSNRLNKKADAEVTFLQEAANEIKYVAQVLNWLEKSLEKRFDFTLAQIYARIALKNKIVVRTQLLLNQFLLSNQFSSPEEALSIFDEFIVAGFDSDAMEFLEIAQLKFPKSDLLKLNLAQILFKKEKLLNALNILSKIKTDDGLLNVQIELMNLMQVKSYSLFHRVHVIDETAHLKNWLVYLINNENWVALYSLNSKIKEPQSWVNDEMNYALAYASANIQDKPAVSRFAERILSPQWAPKKEKLVQFLNE